MIKKTGNNFNYREKAYKTSYTAYNTKYLRAIATYSNNETDNHSFKILLHFDPQIIHIDYSIIEIIVSNF